MSELQARTSMPLGSAVIKKRYFGEVVRQAAFMLAHFLKSLAKRASTDTVFNQYQDKLILANLKAYISYLHQHNPEILLIGEAPGYRGCRLTGIPFTSGDIIRKAEHSIFKDRENEIGLRQVVSENTATILWNFLSTNKSLPILWNAFPFHPHQRGFPESNRKPDISEIDEGKTYLKTIYNLFKPEKLCSLGRVGESILKEVFPNEKIIYIRHPSHGGKKAFIEGMHKVYGSHCVSATWRKRAK